MARGLILGATLLALCGFLFSLVSSFYPLWLAFRTESAGSMCFNGWGIWHANFFQGQDLFTNLVNQRVQFFTCAGDVRSTHDAYCGPNPTPPMNDYDPPNYAANMCDATNKAKITSTMTIVFTLFTALAGCVLEIFPIQTSSSQEFGLALTGMTLSLLTIITSVATQVIMQRSPLFSDAHVNAFTAGSAGISYDSYYSCSFQMPLHSLSHLLFPGTLQCLMPGPSFLCNVLIWLVMGLSAIFFAISAYHTYTKRLSHYLDIGPSEHQSEEDAARKQRVYSLFGGAARRYAHLSPITRNFFVLVLPFVVMMSVTLLWGGFLFLGVQMIAQTTVEIVPSSHDVGTTTTTSYGGGTTNHSSDAMIALVTSLRTFPSYPTMEAAIHAPQPIPLPVDTYNELVSLYTGTSHKEPFIIFRETINTFNFSPTTSLTYFARGGAYLVLVFTALGVFLVPLFRVFIWIWYYYVPSDEIVRGRIMTYQDWLGKWMLSQILIFGWLAMATGVKRHSYVPLPGGIVFHIHTVVGLSVGDGLGSWFYMLTTLCSLFIGQFWLVFHQYCVGWEEDRRVMHAWAKRHASDHSTTTPLLTPLGMYDTPYSGSLSVASSSHQGGNRPLLRAIMEYGSNTDLTASSSVDARALRQPIIRRIGQFGSRTNVVTDTATTATIQLETPMHPFVEAMCDRIHSPVHGVRLRWTTFGKAIMLAGFFALGGITIVSLWLDICEVKRDGMVTYVTVNPNEWKTSYSIVSIAAKLPDAGWQSKAYEQQVFFIFFMIAVPMVRLVALAYLWLLPLTLEQQKHVFDWLEIAGAWSSLDVFWVCMVVMSVELRKITDQLTDLQTPKLIEMLSLLFGDIPGGVLGAEVKLKVGGFAVLTFCVVLEKVVFYLVTEQAVTAISERQAEMLLRSLAYSSSGGGGHGSDSQTVSSSSPPPLPNQVLYPGMLANATQGLLGSGAVLFFSPAARYTIYPRTFYAGLPRFVWAKWFVQLGLLADADRVRLYGSASPSHVPVSPTLLFGGNSQQQQSRPLNTMPIVNDDFMLEEKVEEGGGGDSSGIGVGNPVEF